MVLVVGGDHKLVFTPDTDVVQLQESTYPLFAHTVAMCDQLLHLAGQGDRQLCCCSFLGVLHSDSRAKYTVFF